MKIAFICPFQIDQLTGTPIRAKTTIKAASGFSEAYTVSSSGEGVFGFSLKTIKTLRKIQPDIIHCFSTLGVVPALIYKSCFAWKIKIVFEMHGWAWYETKGVNILKRLIFLIIDLLGYIFANGIIAMSHTQKHFLQRIWKRKGVNVLWGPVDFDIYFVSLPKREKIIFGYLGNGSFWQGIGSITDAAQILSTSSDVHFNLAGFDHSDKEKFPALPNISYFGKLERGKVESFIKECDIMISSRVAGKVSDLQYPHKLSEYLSCGRGVIVSGASDQPQIVREALCGFIVSPMTGESLANQITKILELKMEEIDFLGEKSAEFAKNNFSFPVFKDKLRSVYGN